LDLVLDKEDYLLLKQVLERYISNLRMEIAGTENFEWRKSMHEDEDRAKRLLARLDEPIPHEGESSGFQILVQGFVLQVD